jgi:DNA-binding NtrC family response regulator
MQVAASGEDAFDLLISDIVMPGMSGRELAGSLQAAHPGLLVVLMSGNVDASAMEDLIPGSAAFLGKPFRPSELLDVVRDLRATAARATGNRRG